MQVAYNCDCIDVIMYVAGQTNGKKVNWKQLICVIENERINWNNHQQVSMRTVDELIN